MDTTQLIITIVTSMMASSGLWALVLAVYQRRQDAKKDAKKADSAERKMLLALAHDRIYYLCGQFLSEFKAGARDHMDVDEFHNLQILYDGYKSLGGNGTCKRLYDEVSKIPVR